MIAIASYYWLLVGGGIGGGILQLQLYNWTHFVLILWGIMYSASTVLLIQRVEQW